LPITSKTFKSSSDIDHILTGKQEKKLFNLPMLDATLHTLRSEVNKFSSLMLLILEKYCQLSSAILILI